MSENPELSLAEALADEQKDEQIAELRTSLRRAQAQIVKLRAKREDMADVTIEACADAVLSHGPLRPVRPPKENKKLKGSPEFALLHCTDWQGTKVTPSYNTGVMKKRVMQYATKVAKITEIQRTHHPIPGATLMLGGDMIEGLFNYPTQPFEIDSTLFDQYVTVAMLIVDLCRQLLTVFDQIEVKAEWGNHGRIGSKRAVVPRNDNADRMTYELARRILADEPRISWEDCPEDIQQVQVGNYRAILLHGDEIGRNGYAAPTTIVNHIAKWQSGSYRWEFRDAYLGHYHTHCEWSLPNGLGSVYQTGSIESDNRYAGVLLASSATPSQRLHFVDPEAGRVTASYKVWLD